MKRFLLFLCLVSVANATSFSSSIVGWWKMNDNLSTAVVVDSAGSNAGTFTDVTGDPNTDAHDTVGKVNGAFTFDGTDDFVDIGDTGEDVKSVSLWIKLKQGHALNVEYIVDFNGGHNRVVVAFGTVTIGGFTSPLLYVNGEEGTNEVTIIEGLIWSHIVVTDTTAVDANDFDIGRVTTNYFAGDIDNVMLFDEVLTPADIRYLYNKGTGLEVLDQRNNKSRYLGNYRMRYK